MSSLGQEQQLFELLRQHDFLQRIDEKSLRTLADMGRAVEFPAGTLIFSDGEAAVCFYLILKGTVILEICDSAAGCRQVQTVGNGELLGWSALFENKELTATARTLDAIQAIEFQGAEIAELCERNTDFGYQFFRSLARTLSKRLMAAHLQLIDLFR